MEQEVQKLIVKDNFAFALPLQGKYALDLCRSSYYLELLKPSVQVNNANLEFMTLLKMEFKYLKTKTTVLKNSYH